jgi:hypothetical protein
MDIGTGRPGESRHERGHFMRKGEARNANKIISP